MSLTNSEFIKYLGSYGATSSNKGSYDDHFTSINIDNPFVLPLKMKDSIIEQLNNLNSGIIFVSGSAGDGKTYLCRKICSSCGIFDQENEEDVKNWLSSSQIKQKNYKNKTLYIIKDLSELKVNDINIEHPFYKLFSDILLDKKANILALIAANDGKIIEVFSRLVKVNSKFETLSKKVTDYFFENKKSIDTSNIHIYDLTKTVDREYIETAIDLAVCPEYWNKCQSCHQYQNCPILANREHLVKGADSGFRERLLDVIDLLLANGCHISIRNVLTLISNLILGGGCKNGNDEFVLSCRKVARAKVDKNAIYKNFLGLNLKHYSIFDEISKLLIGFETDKAIDNYLIYNSDDRYYDKFVNQEERDIFYNYLNNMTQDESLNKFKEALFNARLKLFFSYKKTDSININPWSLTIYKHAKDYLALFNYVKTEQNNKHKNYIKRQLIIALNKVFTGLYQKKYKALYVCKTVSYSKAKISPIYLTEFSSNKNGNINYVVKLITKSSNNNIYLPTIALCKNNVVLEKLELTPIYFELLMMIAQGAVYMTFSNEAFDGIISFKTRVIASIEQDLSHSHSNLNLIKEDDNDSLSYISILGDDNDDDE